MGVKGVRSSWRKGLGQMSSRTYCRTCYRVLGAKGNLEEFVISHLHWKTILAAGWGSGEKVRVEAGGLTGRLLLLSSGYGDKALGIRVVHVI